ncbi:hypothetical protein M514_27187 [Trichuris suis]|uniref:Uncharacterized protein n=1 Tax=Trichuris suis TaxID=68888 RepID=A0A085MTU4_9BILA|nr:hypothetical protein M514_27187 [Trichuris suis]
MPVDTKWRALMRWNGPPLSGNPEHFRSFIQPGRGPSIRRGSNPIGQRLMISPKRMMSHQGVDGVAVSMVAFQAIDPGSTPGLRKSILNPPM